jgi:hypothetical protein
VQQDSEKRLGAFKSWGRYVMRELGSARWLVAGSLNVPSTSDKPSRAEVFEHVRPYMAILVHKRARASVAEGASALTDKRWSAELNRHAANCNHLAANEAERARLIELLDQVVAEEQSRMASQAASIPVTSRFDTSWAI